MAVNWTKDQEKVIETRNCNLLVSAAAGSGKTAVLVERIIKMITNPDLPMDIDRLLIVTFTKAAAAEMRERISQAISDLLEKNPHHPHLQRQSTLVHHAQITTIDSFCLYLIKNHFNQLDIDPVFRVADEGELLLLQGDVMKQMLEDYYESGDQEFETFVETYASGKADGGITDYIDQVYRFAMSNPWPEQWLEECRKELAEDRLQSLGETAWMKYLMQDVSIQMKELCEQILNAIAVSGEEDGPSSYLPMLEHDRQMLGELAEIEDYERLNQALKQITFDRLAAIRSKDVDPEKKALVSSTRDRMKKSVGKIKDLYCFLNSEDIMHDIMGSRGPIKTLLDLTQEYMRRYGERKKEKNIVDFNDLEHYALKILITMEDGVAAVTPVAEQLSRQYEEILIDEYQDSNYVQEALLNSISRERRGQPNIFMVGDVKQSIYRFRLARPELFMEKYKTYQVGMGNYQKIELHQNFRSRPSVLESINDVFFRIMRNSLGNVEYTEETSLHPGLEFPETDKTAGTPTQLLLVDTNGGTLKQLDDENADFTARELEARLIARQIRQMTDPQKGLFIWDKKEQEYRVARYGDMVILLRSISGWAEVFTSILMSEGIPAFAESKTGYFTTVEVETVLSMLSVIDNPIQDIPLAAVLKSPIVGVSDSELVLMKSALKKSADWEGEKGLYGAFQYYLQLQEKDELYTKLNRFSILLKDFIDKSQYLTIHELIYEVFQKTGYYDYVSVMPSGDIRRANLDMLVEKACAYEGTSYHGLFHFIRYVERLKKYKTDFGEASTVGEQEDTVRIMSIHKSKGLEFPIVFLSGMGKSFNKQDAYGKILIDPELGIGADYFDLERRLKSTTLKKNVLKRRMELESLGEELRVLYVAMTRAKEKLIMTGTDRSLEKKLEKWKGEWALGKLPFTLLSSAGSYLDWLLMSLTEPTNNIEVIQVPVEELVGQEVERQMVKGFMKEELLQIQENQVFDQAYRELLQETFSYQYPYQEEINLHTKMSVSELKTKWQMVDEEESDFLPTIPKFLQGMQEGAVAGAYRGTAYHRALELLKFSNLHSKQEVGNALKELVVKKRLSKEFFELVDATCIWKLIDSELGKRICAAEEAHKIYREQQFVVGIPAKEMGKGDSEELVLIQGIVDTYFEEEEELVLVDYKTDYIKDGAERILIERYQAQMEYYQKALEQISGKRIKEKIIYSLNLGKQIII